MQTGRGQVIHFHFQNRSDRRLHTTYYMTCTQLEMTGHVCPRPAEPCISGTLATLAWLACQGLSTKTLSATTYKQLTHPDTDLFFGLIQVTPRRQTSQLSLDHCESVTPLSQASVRSCNITSCRLLFHCNSTSNSLFHQFFIPFGNFLSHIRTYITASETERISSDQLNWI